MQAAVYFHEQTSCFFSDIMHKMDGCSQLKGRLLGGKNNKTKLPFYIILFM